MNKKFAISLFSSSGIGDIALKKSKYNVLVANELLEDRSKLYKLNFPETEMITGDIWIKKKEIIKTMQLVGATGKFIRKPFILTYLKLSIFSSIFSFIFSNEATNP